ncbi:MAG: hypothetical protein HKO65_09780 [Gemmatimonadetes bacterium]|nr:exo-alpha-sialidase [Gemmatimonadota bacterium]NNM05382.1 hypothetical protein [Gemmatimonadota bacterium]
MPRGLLLLVLLLATANCSGDGVAPRKATDISLVRVTPKAVAVFVGDTVPFGASVTQLDGAVVDEPTLAWTTSDPGVATIDLSGKLKAIGPGKVTVTATNSGVTGKAEAQVNPVAGADVRLTGSTPFPHQEEPHLAMDGAGHLYVAWKEMTFPGAAERVGFSSSVDRGATWSPVQLRDPLSPGWIQSDPWLGVDESGTLFFASLEVLLSPDGRRVAVSRSLDGGLTWEDTVAAADSTEIDKEVLSSNGAGSLYASYKQGSTLRLVRSVDGGVSWSQPSMLPYSAEDPTGPVLTSRPDGSVFAAWWSRPDDNLWVATSPDHGESWRGLQRVNPVAGSVTFVGIPAFPSVAAQAGGRVSVAWQDFASGDWDILITLSDDSGLTWSGPSPVNDSPLGDQFMPALAAGPDGSLHAVWYDSRTGNVNLVYARSEDGGVTWSTNVRVTTEETPVYHGRLGDYLGLVVGPGGEAFMVWTDRRAGEQNIYFARSSWF